VKIVYCGNRSLKLSFYDGDINKHIISPPQSSTVIDQSVTITRKACLSLLVLVLSLPVIAIALGLYCLPDLTRFPVVSVAVPVGEVSINGVWLKRELGKRCK